MNKCWFSGSILLFFFNAVSWQSRHTFFNHGVWHLGSSWDAEANIASGTHHQEYAKLRIGLDGHWFGVGLDYVSAPKVASSFLSNETKFKRATERSRLPGFKHMDRD
jgi:hypothetical protein